MEKTIYDFLAENPTGMELEEMRPSPITQGLEYYVTLTHKGETLVTAFHGSGVDMENCREPTRADVLNALAIDAGSLLEYVWYPPEELRATDYPGALDAFSDDMGLTRPSEAVRLFEECAATYNDLLRLYGRALTEVLIYDTERL